MPTRELLSPAQRLKLGEVPTDLDDRLVARHHTLSREELAEVRRRRGAENRLGFGVQLALLKFPGRPLRPAQRVPEKVVRYVASQIGEHPAAMEVYARGRDTTRREHFSEIVKTFGFRPFDLSAYRGLSRWLEGVAMSTDSGPALVEALTEQTRHRRIVVPGIFTLERLAWETRRRAQQRVTRKLTRGLSIEQLEKMDSLLVTAPDATRSDLVWLRQSPGEPGPKNFDAVVERLRFIRDLSLSSESSKAGREIHHNRLSRLAAEGARMTPQNLSTLESGRRRATLAAYLLERSAELTDEALGMHERMMIKAHSESKKARDEISREREKEAGQTVVRYAGVGNALILAREQGLDPFEIIDDFIPWETFVQSVGEAEDLARRSSATPDYLRYMEDHYKHLRKYAPLLLESFDFEAAPPAAPLVEAAGVMEELNSSGKRKVPDDAPTAFVKPAWEPYVFEEDGTIDRHNYEMSLLSGLKDGLGSGDVWVSGSNKFKDFEDYLLPRDTYEEMRSSGDLLPALDTDPKAYLRDRSAELHGELCKVGRLLAGDRLESVKLRDGKIKVTRPKKQEPHRMKEFRRRIYSFLPRIRLTDLIVEVDSWTGFSEHLTHVRSAEPCAARELVYAAIPADGTNLGLTRMAEATDDPRVSYKRLAWAADWHVREETYLKATAEIVNAHYTLPFTSHWGTGTTSSSDGQAFFAGGSRDALSQVNAKYGRGRSALFYTHVSDQYAPFYSQVINTTVRDATYVLDGLLYHESDLEIREHSTDTEGFTDQIFGACYLLGYRFVPRIRNINDMNLFSIEKPGRYKDLASRMGGKINTRIILSQWDELSRLMSSIKAGTVTASLILRKLANYPRQNGLAKALQEIGKIERTLFILEWYQDLELRRRVNASLNKGEARNSLARAVFFNRLGELQDRSYEDQMNRASGLAMLSAAIAMWNAVYLERAAEGMRALGEEVPDEYLAHLSPLEWEHITLTGIYRWDLDSTPQQPNGLRPLRGLSL